MFDTRPLIEVSDRERTRSKSKRRKCCLLLLHLSYSDVSNTCCVLIDIVNKWIHKQILVKTVPVFSHIIYWIIWGRKMYTHFHWIKNYRWIVVRKIKRQPSWSTCPVERWFVFFFVEKRYKNIKTGVCVSFHSQILFRLDFPHGPGTVHFTFQTGSSGSSGNHLVTLQDRIVLQAWVAAYHHHRLTFWSD